MTIKLHFILACLGLFFFFNSSAQRGKNLSVTISAPDQVVNTYTTLSAPVTAGATIITVANNTMIGGAFGGSILEEGDLILIAQMYGGTVDVNTLYAAPPNNQSYTLPFSWPNNVYTFGQMLSYEQVGKFERAEVLEVNGTSSITLSCGLTNSYISADRVQIVRIPRYNNLTVNGGASIVPNLWNGTTGGIVALEVDGTLTVNAGGSISASEFGYRGGLVDGFFTPGIASTDLTYPDRFPGSPSGAEGSAKGESIYGYTPEYDVIYSRYGKGAIGNGGGGGGYVNAGGGGGSNAEIAPTAYIGTGTPVGYAAAWALDPTATGSSGGGRGGYCLSQNAQNPLTVGPVNASWGGDARKNNGGYGGHPIPYDATRIFFGGGGGAGDQDSGQGGSGGRGGGIVYIVNYGTIAGSGTIEVNGQDGQNSNPNNNPLGFNAYRGNDGAGGGGAGGTVYIENATAIPNTINITAIGGDGGDQALQVNIGQSMEAGGPGGSGSGGVIRFSAGAPTQNVTAGVNGVTTSTHMTNFPPNGATTGASGESNLPAPYFDLIPNDVTICAGQTANPSVTVSGSYSGTLNWYTMQFGGTPIAGQTNQTTYTVSPVTTTTYYVGVCPGTFRVPVTVTVTAGPTLVTTDPAPLCAPATANITLPAVTAGSDPGTLTYWQNTAATITQATPTSVGAGWHYIQLDAGGGCAIVDSVFVTINPQDDPSFTSSDFCETTTNTISGVATPGGTFTIQSQTGSGGATINASTGVLSGFSGGDQITIEYTTPAGGCQNSSTQVVNVLSTDNASFTSTDFCFSSTNTISGVATLGGTFTIQSQTGSGGATINTSTGILSGFAAGDQITIEYTTAGTCPNSSTQVVNVTNLDNAAFTSTDFCASTTNTISGVATAGGTFSIQSQTGSGGATINASTGILAGFVTGDQITILYTTPAGGCQNTSTQTVNVTSLDDASFASADFCESTTNTISGVVTAGGTFSIQSQTGSGGATINASTGVLSGFTAGDQVTIEYTTAAGGCQNSSTQVVNVIPFDDASFTSTDFCISTTNTISAVASPGGTFSIQSQTGSGGATINASTGILSGFATGDQVTILYTTNGTCPNTSTQVVNVNPMDDASFTSTDFCENATNTISGVATAGGTFTIQSQTGSGGATINGTTGVLSGFAAGDQVTIEYTTPAGGCQNSSTQVVNVNALDDASFTSVDFCVSSVNTISGVATSGGTFTIQSQTGSATINASTGVLSGFASGDQITIEYTTPATGCQNSSTQVVNVTPLDDASFTSTDFCESTVNTISGVATPGGTFSIQSQTGSGGATINASTGILSGFVAGDQVTILYTTNGTCPNTSTQVVNVTTSDDASFTTVDFCESAVNVISAIATPGGTFSIQSQTGSATINATTGELSGFAAGDQITIEYTTAAGACQNSSTQIFNVIPSDNGAFNLTPTCEGATAIVSGLGGGTFTFTSAPTDLATIDGITGTISSGTPGATYSVDYTTNGTCPVTTTQTVIVLDQDDASFTLVPTCDGATALVTGTTGGTFSFAVAPSDAATIDATTGTVSGGTYNALYEVEYTTNGSCPNASIETVIVDDCTPTDMIIPTAFTPGADGANDTWEIVDLDLVYPDNTVRVYNRWGSLVFEHSSNAANPYSSNQWDGTFKGAQLPVASYYFIIESNDGSGNKYEGTVTIVQ